MLDGGLSQSSRDTLSRLLSGWQTVATRVCDGRCIIFGSATLGPGQSHMTYCRILLPHLLDVPRLIYLDCDILVFRDLSRAF